MEYNEYKAEMSALLKKYPHYFWAKKYDEAIHLPVDGGGTECGSVAARLGNNYAPIYMHKPLCHTCLQIKHDRMHKEAEKQQS